MPPKKSEKLRGSTITADELEVPKGPLVSVKLTSYNVMYKVFLSQLALVPFLAASIAHLDLNSPQLDLDGLKPTIFNILVQWLVDNTIWPLYEHSLPSAGSVLTTGAMNVRVTFGLLFDTTHDGNLSTADIARKLTEAYFMGQMMQAHQFMDAIMNLIVRNLNMDSPPLPVHVQQVYSRSAPGLRGLKKLLVDAWIWANRISNGKLPKLTDYLSEFQEDVNATVLQIQAKKYPLDTENPNNPRNNETVDVEINFHALENCLCHGNQGRLKCRYHVHASTEPCWNLIVDDSPAVARA